MAAGSLDYITTADGILLGVFAHMTTLGTGDLVAGGLGGRLLVLYLLVAVAPGGGDLFGLTTGIMAAYLLDITIAAMAFHAAEMVFVLDGCREEGKKGHEEEYPGEEAVQPKEH